MAQNATDISILTLGIPTQVPGKPVQQLLFTHADASVKDTVTIAFPSAYGKVPKILSLVPTNSVASEVVQEYAVESVTLTEMTLVVKASGTGDFTWCVMLQGDING